MQKRQWRIRAVHIYMYGNNWDVLHVLHTVAEHIMQLFYFLQKPNYRLVSRVSLKILSLSDWPNNLLQVANGYKDNSVKIWWRSIHNCLGYLALTAIVDPYTYVKNKSAQKALKLKFCYDYTCISITYLKLGPPLLVKTRTLFSNQPWRFSMPEKGRLVY